ncbi:prepilin-type N-terminal cleavage/methylation domain-containing protein [Luteimonas sp. XNQY3]|nr:prepilin-type N-terminal cleavage/methylation domain-containing protein [Luteimonas sp. XNQY3]MCD9005138.1 prepilin-type N-terminal cleavage/methylation domain-containing protein [Luteimonas sp. XNQY3]
MSESTRNVACVTARRRPRQRGMALVELMIAMVLGLIVVGAAFAVFLSNQRSYSANEGLNRIQEGARVGLELMSRDIRAAGGSACSSASEVSGSGADVAAFRDTPVAGSASSLTVTSAEDSAYRLASANATSITLEAGQLDSAEDAFAVGDALLLCNARKTFLVSATQVSGQTITHGGLPAGYDLASDPYASLATVAVARFRSMNWYVAGNPRGGSSLYVSRQGAAGEEVVEGVQALTLQYRPAGGVYANTPAAGNIDAVHVQLTLSGPAVDGAAMTRTASSVVNVRARTL